MQDWCKSDFLFFLQNTTMTKHITEWERLLQITLNKKYTEIKEKDKIITQLQVELNRLRMQLAENKDTIYNLCNQINRLTKYQKGNAE